MRALLVAPSIAFEPPVWYRNKLTQAAQLEKSRETGRPLGLRSVICYLLATPRSSSSKRWRAFLPRPTSFGTKSVVSRLLDRRTESRDRSRIRAWVSAVRAGRRCRKKPQRPFAILAGSGEVSGNSSPCSTATATATDPRKLRFGRFSRFPSGCAVFHNVEVWCPDPAGRWKLQPAEPAAGFSGLSGGPLLRGQLHSARARR